MSYDLMVFDPAVAPRDRTEFLSWYEAQTEWTEGHSYFDPEVTTPALRDWLAAMSAEFPPMNGPNSSTDYDDPRVTDYCIGRSVIYAAFAWSQAQVAYPFMKRVAREKAVGFFDVSADQGEIWFPPEG